MEREWRWRDEIGVESQEREWRRRRRQKREQEDRLYICACTEPRTCLREGGSRGRRESITGEPQETHEKKRDRRWKKKKGDKKVLARNIKPRRDDCRNDLENREPTKKDKKNREKKQKKKMKWSTWEEQINKGGRPREEERGEGRTGERGEHEKSLGFFFYEESVRSFPWEVLETREEGKPLYQYLHDQKQPQVEEETAREEKKKEEEKRERRVTPVIV